MKILEYKNINRKQWGELVAASGTGTWFQTPEAYEFFASMPELFKPYAIGLEKDGKFRAVCVGYVTVEKSAIKQMMTRRAIVVGGPVLADNCSEEEVGVLMGAIRKHLQSQAIYVETRNFNDYSRWKEAFAKAGFSYQPHLNFHVDCRDKEAMEAKLSENRKRQIRKAHTTAERIMNEHVSEAEIREWYGILRELYRTKVKTPLWPVEFFLEAYRQGVAKFLLVRHEGNVMGGSMVVADRQCVYEWYECGLNAVYKEQYPSVMATWAGMTMAHDTGCARYDMMGAGEPGVPYGVRDFKSEFGGEMVEHGRFLCISKPVLYKIGVMGVKILKKLNC